MHLFHDILLVLFIAVLIISLLRLVNLPPILGYLIAGCLAGPSGLHLFDSVSDLAFVAEFGVVFLLFTIGLELSIPKLIAMRRSLLFLGGLQVLITTLIVMGTTIAVGVDSKAAFAIAGAITLSSTAVVTKQLLAQGELYQEHGKACLSILLFQDLAAIPFLILVPSLGDTASNLWVTLGVAMLKGTVIVSVLMIFGHRVLRPLFHQVSLARSTELFVLTTLMVALAAAWLTEEFGLSMALGGFLAGAILAETEYRHQIERDIEPFRDIFLGFFFVTVGMKLDPAILISQGHWVLLIVAGIFSVKFAVIGLLAHFNGLCKKTAIRTGLCMAQGGEFGFALLALASTNHVMSAHLEQFIIAPIIISLAISPILIRKSKEIAGLLTSPTAREDTFEDLDAVKEASEQRGGHAIICGFGRTGQHLARFLEREGIPYIGLDLDPMRLKEATGAGEPVFYGDSTRMQMLQAAGIATARILLITYNDHSLAIKTIKTVRQDQNDLPILVRAKDDRDLEAMQQAGATEVVPEAFESSLKLASHMLLLLDMKPARVSNMINDVMNSRYRLLKAYYKSSEELADEHDSLAHAQALHPVTITEKAFAVDKTIAEVLACLPSGLNVAITAFKRQGIKSAFPNLDTKIRPNDIIVFQGYEEELSLAEEKFLTG